MEERLSKMHFLYQPITFNNPLKICFSNKKSTPQTQIVISIFLIEKPVFNEFLKIISAQNQ